MLEAVFISDLHLHPCSPEIQSRFDIFITWASCNTRSVYILGDFLHAWPGDDSMDDWSEAIAMQLHGLVQKGIAVYYLHGNRDFLLGERFAARAGMKILLEPSIIQLGPERIFLAHGDQFCTRDKAHQWFRWFTRNRWFPICFLKLPISWRVRLMRAVRKRSKDRQNEVKRRQMLPTMDIVVESMLTAMRQQRVRCIIRGHTHRPREAFYTDNGKKYREFVLSDWDASPEILCYNSSRGLFFKHLI